MKKQLRSRQKIGKYRIEKLLARGGFANVYSAMDTIEGTRVALKIPHLSASEILQSFKNEVRLTAKLDHPNIMPIKNADLIDGDFFIAYELGERTLSDRLARRLSTKLALSFSRQLLSAMSYAHRKNIIHCDIKPENIVILSENTIKLTDFGIARFTYKTVQASGTGTIGYIAPEQAMGKPSFRSDVFSLGLVIYRMFAGVLPEYPYNWPLPGFDTIRKKLSSDVLKFLKRAIEPDPRKRFKNVIQMENAFNTIKNIEKSVRNRKKTRETAPNWEEIRFRQFQRLYGRQLETRCTCERCSGPISETMIHCPWCGRHQKQFKAEHRFTRACPRCKRGLKSDWNFCPWCYGAKIGSITERELNDKRYSGRCSNHDCSRRVLMPFMRYCPWCNRRIRKAWKIENSKEHCSSCGWGLLKNFWSFCPWCGKKNNR